MLCNHMLAAESLISGFLSCEILPLDRRIAGRRMGLIRGIDLSGLNDPDAAKQLAARCFQQGLLIERVRRRDTMSKIQAPLTIAHDLLIIKESIADYLSALQEG